MSPDNIEDISLQLYDFLVNSLGCDLNEDQDYVDLNEFMLEAFDKFCTRDRNYN